MTLKENAKLLPDSPLNHLKKHPHHSNSIISDGTPLYIYQDEACRTVLEDYQLKRGIYNHINILKIPTGDGKTFITEHLVKSILDLDKEYENDTSKKTIFLCSPLLEVLEDMKEKMISLRDSRDDIMLFFDKEERGVEGIRSYDKSHSMGVHKIFVFSDQWAEHNHYFLPEKCDFLERDESKGLTSSSSDEARRWFSEYNWQGKWYKKIISYGGYVLLLNATPTDAQYNSKSFNILNIEVKPNLWKKPFLNEHHALYADTKDDKEFELKRFIYDFLHKNLTYRYRVDLIGNESLTKHKKKSAIIKCSTANAYHGLLTWQVSDIIKEYNKELTGTIFSIENPKTKEIIKHKYEGDLLCPMIKDKDNEGKLKYINSFHYKENILIVCELGTYGVNVKNCSHLFLLRDSKDQHIGKVYTAEQLYGRLKRNLWNDWIFMIDKMLDLPSITIEDYDWIRDTFTDVASKNLWFLQTNVNNLAFTNFIQEMPRRKEIQDTIDDLVLNLFKWKPDSNGVMISTGNDEDRNYTDVRFDKCDCCDNLIFDIHYDKLIQRGYSKVSAMAYAIKDVMQNAHKHTNDDGTQRSVCNSCHAIETREKKHYLPSDHPDRESA